MRFLKILTLSLMIFTVGAAAFAGEHSSTNYSISNTRVVPAGGQASSRGFRIDYIAVGNVFGGQARSTNYSINATESAINLNPPAPNFTAAPVSGANPLTTQFTNQTTGISSEYVWDFGDGGKSTLADPPHTYYLSGAQMGYQADTLPLASASGWERGLYYTLPPSIERIENNVFRLKCDHSLNSASYKREVDLRGAQEYAVETRFKLGDYNAMVDYGAMGIIVYDDT